MSLRARVLVGTAAIAAVLAVAALAVTQIIEAHLVHQVDQQLASASRSFERNDTVCFAQRVPDGAGEAAVDLDGDGIVDTPPATEGTTTSTESTADGEAGATSTSTVPPTTGATTPDGGAPEIAELPSLDERVLATCTGSANGVGTRAARVLEELSTIDVGIVATSGPDDGGAASVIVVPLLPEASFDPGAAGVAEVQEETPPPRIDLATVSESARTGEPFTTSSQGSGPRHRARAVINADTGWPLVVSQSLADVDATVGRLVAVEAAATVAILGVLALVAWWVIRHGIRPVKQMTATASAIAAGDLSHRVPEPDLDRTTEAGQLGVALNQMLGRIEHAFHERTRSETRLRQFVADASHELRTPVTTIRGYSELYESGGLDEDEELSEAMRRTRQEAVRMGNLVDDMLLLARLDEGRPLDRERVDVAALARDAGRDARAVDPDRTVVTATQGPLEVLGDGDRLRQVIANLVGNALVHTPSSARLDIRARRDGDRAVVEVSDRGEGMPPDVLGQAFDRFYRADPSRSRHRGGSGLGLAIVQAAVAAHGGEVALDSTPGEGTTARITLPLAPAVAGDDDCQEAHR